MIDPYIDSIDSLSKYIFSLFIEVLLYRSHLYTASFILLFVYVLMYLSNLLNTLAAVTIDHEIEIEISISQSEIEHC